MTADAVLVHYARRRGVRSGIWPVWARLLSRRRAPGDRGVGDTAEHVHGLLGSDGFGVWYAAVFGRRPCVRCPGELNRVFPYS